MADCKQTPQEPMARSQIERMKKDKEVRLAIIYGIQTHLLDPNFVSLQANYSNFLMTWLVRLVDPKGKHPQQMIEMPLPEEAPRAFDMLPEFIFEDVIGFYAFISRCVCFAFACHG
jgi:ubiquitin conjugation factor E4 B